jgi:uncharacterized integral membrane protein (TIGR00698 family)
MSLLPGLILAGVLAIAAALFASFTILPSVLIGLVLGMLLSGRGSDRRYEPGLTFGSKAVLRVGVALLGAQVTIPQIIDLGPAAALIAVGGLILCLVLGYLLARALRLSAELALLTSAAVAICGASATLAVSAVLPRSEASERNAGATVAAITVIGTAAMISYPLVAELAGMDGQAAGIFFGASLHEVVQAVGAGFTHSELAGEVSATVKLIRVAWLAPVVAMIGWWSHRSNADGEGRRPPLLPLFLIGFLALATLASIGAIPSALLPVLREASRLCLLVAIVALGTKIAPRRLLAFGPRPLLAIVGQTLILAGFAFGAVFYWGS